MHEISQCPNCGSSQLYFNGQIDSPQFEINSDKLSAIKTESAKMGKYEIGCNGCHSELKITKDGVRVANK